MSPLTYVSELVLWAPAAQGFPRWRVPSTHPGITRTPKKQAELAGTVGGVF